ncbi:MAG TPA: STAS domain-containing protein [Methylophilaceae bacterium]|nr:STAS domain-containing protein [Methylophilaceae bacterium]
MAQIVQEGNCWRVSGPMTVEKVNALLEESGALAMPSEIDLDQVSEVDTTAISMLFEWQRKAQAQNNKITFLNLPDNLVSLARLYGVSDLIPQAVSH